MDEPRLHTISSMENIRINIYITKIYIIIFKENASIF